MITVKKIHLCDGMIWVNSTGSTWMAVVEIEGAGAPRATLHGCPVLLEKLWGNSPHLAVVYFGASPPPLAVGDVIEEEAAL